MSTIKLTPTAKLIDLDALLAECRVPTAETQSERSVPTAECRVPTAESKRVEAWRKEHCDLIRIYVDKGVKARMQEEAKRRGCTLKQAILEAFKDWCDK